MGGLRETASESEGRIGDWRVKNVRLWLEVYVTCVVKSVIKLY